MICICCDAPLVRGRDYYRCIECGYCYDPTPIDRKSYGLKHRRKLWSQVLSAQGAALRELRWAQVCRWVDITKRHTLCDFGCGYGDFVFYINQLRNVGVQATGYDLFIHPWDTDCERKLTTATVITAWDSLEHLETTRLIGLLRTAASDNRWLIASMPAVEGMPQDIAQSHHFRPGEHVHYFTASAIANLLRRCGFETMDVNYCESTIRIKDASANPYNILTVAAHAC